MPDFSLDIFLTGCAGGLLPDVLRIVRSRHDITPHGYLKSPTFWVGLFFLIGLGGLAAWILGASNVTEALAFGFAAPELISQLVGGVSRQKVSTVATDVELGHPELIRWWQA